MKKEVCPSWEGMIRIMMEKYNGTTCLPLTGGDFSSSDFREIDKSKFASR